ncbi:hypothetical protein PHLGIDRAFT_34439 [Phlebiopsis gigantea 11061_1 CR5-6]|uniref:MYND-type domain-containing protein n=1 Tax=Phlebiopsis gigantea (strain 11061_1 CR5-6) TaxID=745531 RepID=A0A0C3PQL2_PHLG1|nr:hypothetical protein PHLGIDRAFT_34439 [Phlebiopsis gigantea 11061_1 CR5-6]
MPYVCFNLGCSCDIPRNQVKRCARCRVATYCSKACQVSAWKINHRDSCVLHEGLVRGPDGKLREPDRSTEAGRNFQLEKRLDKWLQHWRRIIYSFTPFAQDLANHPDRPESHCMTIWVKPNHDPQRDKYRDFLVQKARMVPLTELRRYMVHENNGLTQSNTIDTDIWPDVVMFRSAIVVNDPSEIPGRVMRHGFRDIGQWREMDKRTSAMNGAKWDKFLIDFVAEKDPTEVMNILRGGRLGLQDSMYS